MTDREQAAAAASKLLIGSAAIPAMDTDEGEGRRAAADATAAEFQADAGDVICWSELAEGVLNPLVSLEMQSELDLKVEDED